MWRSTGNCEIKGSNISTKIWLENKPATDSKKALRSAQVILKEVDDNDRLAEIFRDVKHYDLRHLNNIDIYIRYPTQHAPEKTIVQSHKEDEMRKEPFSLRVAFCTSWKESWIRVPVFLHFFVVSECTKSEKTATHQTLERRAVSIWSANIIS